MSVKNELRTHFRKMRQCLSDKADRDNAICSNVISFELFKNAEQILCYYPLENEISTLKIIGFALQSNKKIALPYCNDANGNMEFYYISSLNNLKSGLFGIMEPDISVCEKVLSFDNSLCIVPAFSFDKKGYRLGYGKGYYDKFLKKFTFYSIGLCYNDFLKESLPVDFYDVAVDFVASEDRVILCKED